MNCPHGYIDIISCPECSKASHVNPLQRANKATFTELKFDKDSITTEQEEEKPIDIGKKAIPLNTLKLKRLGVENQGHPSPILASPHLQARLNQILEPSLEEIALSAAVEKRVKEIKQHSTNPNLKRL